MENGVDIIDLNVREKKKIIKKIFEFNFDLFRLKI
jgi:hypothetical protein